MEWGSEKGREQKRPRGEGERHREQGEREGKERQRERKRKSWRAKEEELHSEKVTIHLPIVARQHKKTKHLPIVAPGRLSSGLAPSTLNPKSKPLDPNRLLFVAAGREAVG